MRIVLDNNIVVRAAASPAGPAGALLELLTPPHLWLLSTESFQELAEVLRYERVRALHGFSDERIAEFLDAVMRAALIVALPPGTPPRIVPGDADDDWLVALAVQGQADVLCTRDRDLFHADVLAYCRGQGVEVMNDLDLLARLRAAAQP